MLTIAKNKFFARYLPMFLTVVVIVGAVFTYQIFNNNTKVAEAGWYSTGGTWGYRKPITIDKNKVNTATGTTTPLSNFPVLISVTDPDLIYSSFGGKVGKSDGTDILFTSGDGTTKLNHEIESYSSSTGTSIFWVQVTSLAKTSDTVLYIYFGNAGASDQQNINGTWDSNYKDVQHFPNGTILSSNDSTGNGNNGTLVNTPTAATGKIDGAANFVAASSQQISLASGGGLNNQQTGTMEAWAKWTGTQTAGFGNYGYGYIFGHQKDGLWSDLFVTLDGSNPATAKIKFYPFNYFSNAGDAISTNVIGDNIWHHVVVTYASTTQQLFVDGVLNSTGTDTGIVNNDASVPLAVGSFGTPTTAGYMNGNVDEVRTSTIIRSADWIATEYNNQSSPSTFYAYGTLGIQNRGSSTPSEGFKNRGASGSSWYNASWGYRKQITIDHNKVSGVASSTLSNFPMLFSVNDPDLKYTGSGGKVGRSDGLDMVFTNADGTTPLNYEMESYSSSTGATIAWVKVPILSAVTDTTLYVYYGNAGSGDQSNKTSVWDSNYVGVWHLPNGTILTANDSTSNSYNGSLVNSPTGTAGKIDGAGAFGGPGLNQAINNGVVNGIASLSTATLSGWMYRSDPNNYVNFGQVFANYRFNFEWYNDGFAYFQPENGSQSFPSFTPPQTTGWHYISCTFNGAQTGMARVACYWDGVAQSLVQGGGNLPPSTLASSGNQHNFYIGFGNSYTTGNIDEVRVSNNIRSADWVATEYANQNFPSAFYAYGGVSVNGRQTSSGGTPPAIKVRGGVKFK